MRGTLKLLILFATWACFVAVLAPARSVLPHVRRDNTITFVTDGATRASYNQFIQTIRDRVKSGEVNGIPVLRERSTGGFITVELNDSQIGMVTIGIDMTDLYVVGYLADMNSYFLKDIPDTAYQELFKGSRINNLTFSGSYTDLERVANQRRVNISLGLEPLRNAISDLRGNEGKRRARALIIVIQMVSEAARFKYISDQVGRSIGSYTEKMPDQAMLSMENNWSKLSESVQAAVQQTFEREVILTNRDGSKNVPIKNVEDAAKFLSLMLLVCRRSQNQFPLLIRTVVDDTPTCTRFEPVVRISGRDGMCVEVSNNVYTNGNPITVSTCGTQLEDKQLWTLRLDNTIRSKGKCLTSSGRTAGSRIVINDCQPTSVIYWEVRADGTIVNPATGFVLSAESGTVGGVLTLERNEYKMSQGWSTGNDTSPLEASISGYSGLCMEASSTTSILLANCDNSRREQQWELYPDGSIRSKQDTRRCAASQNTGTTPLIVISDCSTASAAQRWVFKSDGTINNPSRNMVMEERQSTKQIVLSQATGSNNQKWIVLF